MNSFYYILEQVWLAHKEAGLETWVQVQLVALAVLSVAWVFGWIWAGAKAIVIARSRFAQLCSAARFGTFVKHPLHTNETPA